MSTAATDDAREWFGFRYLERKDDILRSRIKPKYVELLDEAHDALLERPVDIETLAVNVDLKYRYDLLPPKVYGALQKVDGKHTIRVLRSDIPERQRFTFAHELAHYFLHVDSKGKSNLDLELREDVLLRSDQTTELEELEANALAAHILMPIHKIRELFSGPYRNMPLKDVAQKFQVSRQAMQVRLGFPIV